MTKKEKRLYRIITTLAVCVFFVGMFFVIFKLNAKYEEARSLYYSTDRERFLEIKSQVEIEGFSYFLAFCVFFVAVCASADVFIKYKNINRRKNMRILFIGIGIFTALAFALSLGFRVNPQMLMFERIIYPIYILLTFSFLSYFDRAYKKAEKKKAQIEKQNELQKDESVDIKVNDDNIDDVKNPPIESVKE
jgi:amino acid transporter